MGSFCSTFLLKPSFGARVAGAVKVCQIKSDRPALPPTLGAVSFHAIHQSGVQREQLNDNDDDDDDKCCRMSARL